ncbi:MAG: hypothetical protein JWQ25_2186 [Daejeonella sp.]|nr:hypothetical protein [Daejeonella sp.]
MNKNQINENNQQIFPAEDLTDNQTRMNWMTLT